MAVLLLIATGKGLVGIRVPAIQTLSVDDRSSNGLEWVASRAANCIAGTLP